MRWLVLLVLGGCAFFQSDDRQHRGAVPDAATGYCSSMIVSGEACTNEPPCIWSEGLDGGVADPHRCTCSGGHWTCTNACPAQPAQGAPCDMLVGACSYAEANGHTLTCGCTSTGWRCSDCPSDFASPSATCTPGDTCQYEDWEHGCNCLCSGGGQWSCTPETSGSMCPSHTFDAGI